MTHTETSSAAKEGGAAPLAGVRVVEFSHMIMGPSCGMVLGDLGADVLKVEPTPDGDKTRRLTGSGAGFFPMFNRNKRSIEIRRAGPQHPEAAVTVAEGQGHDRSLCPATSRSNRSAPSMTQLPQTLDRSRWR